MILQIGSLAALNATRDTNIVRRYGITYNLTATENLGLFVIFAITDPKGSTIYCCILKRGIRTTRKLFKTGMAKPQAACGPP